MSQKKGIIIGVIICELVLLPFVYFFMGRSVTAVLVTAEVIPIFVTCLMIMLNKKGEKFCDAFKARYPNENILYSGLAELYGNPNTGSLIITENHVCFLQKISGEIKMFPFDYKDIKAYSCDASLTIVNLHDDVIRFKVFDAIKIDKILREYILYKIEEK
ncbi:MAG TPA: hypothetical protein GX401_06185 [Clostridiales bacterium]|nr:hypothetical protein [Clostridiales bacterium]